MVCSFLIKILVISHCCNETGVLTGNLNNNNLHNNFDEDDPDILIRLLA